MNTKPAQLPRETGRDGEGGRIHFAHVLLTLVHLIPVGIFGTVVISVAASFFAAGVSTVVVFGLGFLFLAATTYLLFGAAWCETERVRGLYGLEIAPLTRITQQQPGFVGWLRMLGQQSIDPRMWRKLSTLFIGTVVGFTVYGLLHGVANMTGLIVRAFQQGDTAHVEGGLYGLRFATDVGWWIAIVIACVALSVVLAALQAVASRNLLTHQSRRELAAEARHHADEARASAAEAEERGAQREGAVRAAELERTRIERDLHDGVQPRLVSVGMTLGLAQQKIDSDPDSAKALLNEAHTSTKAAITELRQLARGIHTSVLDDRGLDAALSALAARSHIPVHLDVRLDGRPATAGRELQAAEAVA